MPNIHDQPYRPLSHDPESERQVEQFLKKSDKPHSLHAGKSGFWPFGKSYLTVTTEPNSSTSLKCERVFHGALNIVNILKVASSKLQPASRAAEGLAEYAQTSAPTAAKEAVKEFVLTMAPSASRGQFVDSAITKFEAILAAKMGTKGVPELLLTAFLSGDDSKLTPELKKQKESIIRDWKEEFAKSRNPELQWTLGFVLPKEAAARFFAIESRCMKLADIRATLPEGEALIAGELSQLRAHAGAGQELTLTKEEIAALEDLLIALPTGDAAHDVASLLVYTCPASFAKHSSDLFLGSKLGAPPKSEEGVEMLQSLARLASLEKGPVADALKLTTLGKVEAADKLLKSIVLTAPLSATQIGQLLDLIKLSCEEPSARVLIPSIAAFMTAKSALIVPHMTLDLRASLPEFKGMRGLDDKERNTLADAIDALQAAVKLTNDPIEILHALAEKMTPRTAVYSRVEMQKILSKNVVSRLDAKKAANLLTKALAETLKKEESGESAKLLSEFLLARKSLHDCIPKETLQALIKLSTGSLWQARMDAEQNIRGLANPIDTINLLTASITAANVQTVSAAIGKLIPEIAEGTTSTREATLVLITTLMKLLQHPSAESSRVALLLAECMVTHPALCAHITATELQRLLDAASRLPVRELIKMMNPVTTLQILADGMGLARDEQIAAEIGDLLQKIDVKTIDKAAAEALVEALYTLFEKETDAAGADLLLQFLLKLPNVKTLIAKERLQPLIEAMESPPTSLKKLQSKLQ